MLVKAGQSTSMNFERSSCKSFVFMEVMINEVLPMDKQMFIIGSDSNSVLQFSLTIALNEDVQN